MEVPKRRNGYRILNKLVHYHSTWKIFFFHEASVTGNQPLVIPNMGPTWVNGKKFQMGITSKSVGHRILS